MRTLALFFIVWMLSASAGNQVWAAPSSPAKPAPSTDDDDLMKNRWAEAQAIIDDIKTQNPPDTFKFKAKLGLIQTINNWLINAVGIGMGGNLPAISVEAMSNFWGSLGLEVRDIYAQNINPDPTSPNGASAYMNWFDIGPRYTFYLDSTRLDNNIVFKILYHENYNNFLLRPSVKGYDYMHAPWVNYYSGVSLAFERNIPITSKLGITGAFDLLQIFNAAVATTNPYTGNKDVVARQGYGFEVQAEIYYKTQWGKYPTRMGFGYWQQGNANELEDNMKQTVAHNSYFQVSRALFGTWAVLF